MRNILFIFFIFLLLFLTPNINAQERQDNKYGIHLAQPHLEDLKKASELVNSNGGDWGYVTLVIQDNDRSHNKWQEIFDLLRQYHLIPIIRIATHPEGAEWKRPVKEDANSWADFLDSLNWVVKNRYVVLFNEPNHGSEWGGTVDVQDYGATVKEFAEKLKTKNSDFFLMLGALDSSAPTSIPRYLGEEYFVQNLTQVIAAADFERLFDGLASHSYPNPAFSGSPWDAGRGTIRSYQWELDLLKNNGITKNLPVFITETGWTDQRLSRETIASYYQTAFQSVWLPDGKVVAITPFVFDYQGDPFLGFSWKLPSAKPARPAGGATEEQEFYKQYYTVQSLPKTAGDPEIVDFGELTVDLPQELIASSNYHFRIKLKNTGQAIWDKNAGYQLSFTGNTNAFEYVISDLKNIKPFETADIDLFIKTNGDIGNKSARLLLKKNDKAILETDKWLFKIDPLPSLKFEVQLYPKLTTEGERFEIQIFDASEELVFKKSGLKIRNSKGYVNDIQNIIPGKQYRIVLLNPYYLPRQTQITFQRDLNTIIFKRMYPLDLDGNGHVDWGDLGALIIHPELMQLFFP